LNIKDNQKVGPNELKNKLEQILLHCICNLFSNQHLPSLN